MPDNPFAKYVPQKTDNPFAKYVAAAPKQESSAWDVPTQVTGGFNEGIANVLGAPVDLAAAGLSLLGISDPETAVGGSAWIKRRFSDIGSIPDAPETRAERYARSVGQNVGEGAAMLTGGGAVAQGLRHAPGLTGKVARVINEGIVRRPGAVAAAETGAGVTAGIGGELATEIAPDDPMARFYGELAGGVGGPAAVGGTVAAANMLPTTRLARNVARNITPAGRRAEARKSAAKSIGEATSGRSEANLREAADITDRIAAETGDRLDLTLAERTNAPSLIANQEVIEAGKSGVDLDRLIARRQTNREVIDRFAKTTGPGRAARASIDIETELPRQRQRRLMDIEKAQQKLDQRDRRLVSKSLPDDVNVADAGDSLRASIRAAREAKQAEMTALADDLGLNADTNVPFHSAAAELVNRYDNAAVFDKPAETPEIIKILREVAQSPIDQNTGRPKVRLTFDDYQSLIRRLGDDHREAISQGKYTLARKLRSMRDDAEDLAETAFAQAADPKLQENYRVFRDIYRKEFAQRFRQGSVSKILSRKGTGEYVLTDEAVALQFFNRKSVTAARQLQDVLGPEDAAKHIRTAALYDLRANAVVDGILNNTKLRSWLSRNREALKEYPSLLGDVADIEKAKGALLRQQAGLRIRQKALEDGALNRALRGMEQGTKSADDIIRSALGDPRLMREMLDRLKAEPAARAALRRKVWETISAQGMDVETALKGHRDALEIVLSKKHLRDLETVFKAREITARTHARHGAREGVPTSEGFKEAVGISPQGLANRILQVKGGFIGGRYAVLDILSRAGYAFDARQVRALQEQALYDPDVAESLMRVMESKRVLKRQKVRLRGYLLDSGNDSEPRSKPIMYRVPSKQADKNAVASDSDPMLPQLRRWESDDDYTAQNKYGYLGAYQFGEAALIDLGYAVRSGSTRDNANIKWSGRDGIKSTQDFLTNPDVQDKAAREWMALLWDRIKSENLDSYVGKTVGNIKLTKTGMLAAAHLLGTGGLATFIRSKGKIIPKDGRPGDKRRTPITKYLKGFQRVKTAALTR